MSAYGQTRAWIALTLVASLWGSYPAFAKRALVDLPPFVLVTLRTSAASLFLLLLLRRRGWSEFQALGQIDLRSLAFLGFAGIFVSTGGTYLAIAFTTASSAVILQAATPVMVALGARLYLRERLTPTQWTGVLVSAVGVGLVITRGRWQSIARLDFLPGDFVVLVALAGWSAYTIYGKRVLLVHSPGVATTGAYLVGSLMLLPMPFLTAPWFPTPNFASPVAWLVVAYQAFLGAVAHVWWYEGVKAVGPSRTAIFMNLQPVVGVLLAWATLGEAIGLAHVIGGLLVLAGVAVTTGHPGATRSPPPR